MALQIGIVGLPNSGKSTLFNALTHAHAAVASYPFTTIDPNIGVAEVPDARLEQIAALIRPKRAVAATVEFADIAGLVKGASRGEGLGNQFLGHIRNVDAIAMVLRCFTDVNVPHQFHEIDPLLDLDTVNLELILSDVGVVERRLEKARSAAKADPKGYAAQIDGLQRLKVHLNKGLRASLFVPAGQEEAWLAELGLLSSKPQLLVANVDEDELPDGGELSERLAQRAWSEGCLSVVLSAKLEAELADLPPGEATAFREELGLGEAGLTLLTHAGYRLLDLLTFFTATGQDEVRAWPLRRGKTVWDAAGQIHTDMQRGFIRADVINWQDLLHAGSWAKARESGTSRMEGREYIVGDGDVIHIRFNV